MKKHIEHRHNGVPGNAIQLPMLCEANYHDARAAFIASWPTRDIFRIHYVLEGEYALKINNRESFILRGGQFCVIPPGMASEPVGGAFAPHRSCNLALMPTHPKALLNSGLTKKELKHITSLLMDSTVCAHLFGDPIRDQCEAFAEMLSTYTTEYAAPLSSAMLRLTLVKLILLTAYRLGHLQPVDANIYADAATRFMQEHLTDQITLKEIADHLGYSLSRTHALIKSGTGLSPHAYLLRLRINEAADALGRTTKRISDIALDTGFGSSQHFSRTFKRHMNCSPSEYRRRHQQDQDATTDQPA